MDSTKEQKPQAKPGSSERIEKAAQRRIAARRDRERSVWYGMGMFGLIGWSVAIPTLLGAALGTWLDDKWPGEYSYVLMFLVTGLIIGCINAWYWVKQVSKNQ